MCYSHSFFGILVLVFNFLFIYVRGVRDQGGGPRHAQSWQVLFFFWISFSPANKLSCLVHSKAKNIFIDIIIKTHICMISGSVVFFLGLFLFGFHFWLCGQVILVWFMQLGFVRFLELFCVLFPGLCLLSVVVFLVSCFCFVLVLLFVCSVLWDYVCSLSFFFFLHERFVVCLIMLVVIFFVKTLINFCVNLFWKLSRIIF